MSEDERPDGNDTQATRPVGRKLYHALLGLAVVSREEGSRLFDHLAERGGPLEEPVRQRARQARREASVAGRKLGRALSRPFRRYVAPGEDEIAEVSGKIERLGARVDRLGS